jgi:hypothetical protein
VFDETRQAVLGPFPVAGRSRIQADVKESGLPAGRELKACAALAGQYIVKHVFPMAGASLTDIREFGRYGIIALEPLRHPEGDATAPSEAAIYIHGGSAGGDGSIRSTVDSLRLRDSHMHELVSFLAYNTNVTACLKPSTVEKALSTSSDSAGSSPAGYVRKIVSALPLGFAAIPGLFPASAEAQATGQCYDSGSDFSDVDFTMINLQSGGDALAGYVPGSTSGVTIAGGLDLGILTSAQLLAMGFDATQVGAWTPYLATSCGNLVGAAAVAALNANPLSVTAAYAQAIDSIYYTSSANTIGSLYNQLVTQLNVIPGHTFSQLPLRYQTAMVAMNLTNTSFGTSTALMDLAKGQWTTAINALRNYGSSNATINKLAHMYADYMAKGPAPTF